jgi:hypothetical protein
LKHDGKSAGPQRPPIRPAEMSGVDSDGLMQNWRFYRQLLNQLPVRHENWMY